MRCSRQEYQQGRLYALRQTFARDGYEASGMPPADFAKFLRSVSERWAAVIRDVGVKLDQ
jgi:tripartite-type tricarboxylate transporter receptor subunit TctC